MDVTIYTTKTCPKCKVLKQKMTAKNINFSEVDDIDILISKGITKVPVLEVDGTIMMLEEANDWINKIT